MKCVMCGDIIGEHDRLCLGCAIKHSRDSTEIKELRDKLRAAEARVTELESIICKLTDRRDKARARVEELEATMIGPYQVRMAAKTISSLAPVLEDMASKIEKAMERKHNE